MTQPYLFIHRLYIPLVLFFMVSFTGPANAQDIHTYVDKDSLRVGDEFTLSIVIDGSYSLESYPGDEAFSDDLELRNRQRFQDSVSRDSIVYYLQFFSLEDLVIEPLEFELQTADGDTTVQSNRIPLFFKSTLAGEDEELRPLKPIFDFARSYWPYLLAALFLAAIGYYLYNLLKQRAKQDVFIPKTFSRKPFTNPLTELEKSIQKLSSEKPPANEQEFEQFYIRLGDAIRTYLKRVYEFPALEMTSGEIIRKLQKLRASSELIKKVRKILYDADMVKFAKFNPASDQVADAIKTGIGIVETVKTVDSERIAYLEYLHSEEQKKLEEAHELKEQKRKQEFEE